MDEQHNDTDPVDETGETTSDAGSESGGLSLEQLNAWGEGFQKQILGEVSKKVAGIVKTVPRQQQTQSERQAKAPEPQQQDVAALLKRERGIERALARNGLSDEQGDLVRSLIDVQKPEDVTAFIGNVAKTMGVSVGESKTESQTQAKATVNPNPASDGGAPGRTAAVESDDVPVWKWSQERTEQYIKKHGMRKFAEEMKKRLPQDLKGVNFTVPRG